MSNKTSFATVFLAEARKSHWRIHRSTAVFVNYDCRKKLRDRGFCFEYSL